MGEMKEEKESDIFRNKHEYQEGEKKGEKTESY